MFPSSDSIAYHLTPRGWRGGNVQRGGLPFLCRPAPLDQVLSFVYTTDIDSEGSCSQTRKEVWRSRDVHYIYTLLVQYGPAPEQMSAA
jgi:hypothetical protein